MDVLKKIFGNSVHLQILLLYHGNRGLFDNITGLAQRLKKSHVTVRGAVADLLKTRILKETSVGKSRVISIDSEGPYTGMVMGFLDDIKTKKRDMYLETRMREG